MVIKIIAIVIGVLILSAGLYYLSKEKHGPESRKIYGVISAVGAVIALAAAILLLVCKAAKKPWFPLGTTAFFDIKFSDLMRY